MAQALQTIERRVNELGVAEPIVARHSAGDQILVQLPGVTDVARAKEIIRSTALLELKHRRAGARPDEALLGAAYAGNVPPDLEFVPARIEGAPGQPASTVYYLVRRVAGITGRDLRNARPSLDENNQPAVSFSLNKEGADKFGKLTRRTSASSSRSSSTAASSRRRRFEARIYDEGRITGTFTQAGSAGSRR